MALDSSMSPLVVPLHGPVAKLWKKFSHLEFVTSIQNKNLIIMNKIIIWRHLQFQESIIANMKTYTGPSENELEETNVTVSFEDRTIDDETPNEWDILDQEESDVIVDAKTKRIFLNSLIIWFLCVIFISFIYSILHLYSKKKIGKKKETTF
jgi:ATP-dependent Zn protease